jgi:MYXO-CTERM domain-containing protein
MLGGARVRSGDDGAGATRQQTRQGEGAVLLAVMAMVGALQRRHGAVVVRMEAGTHAGGHG